VRLLLDTHALIWVLIDGTKLPQKAADAITDPDNDIYVSAASAWEIAAKYRKGKLPEAGFLVANYRDILREQDMLELPINSQHALRSGLLDLRNPDPFDRMIVAQCQIEGLAAVSNEEDWDGQGIVRLWG
jgi:PIN domain nuclease of toxin-antitoxin system